MKKKNVFLVIALFALIFISGCDKTDEITNPGISLSPNTPSIANTSKSFSFAVNAKTYNSALEYPLSFSGQTFDYNLALSSYSTGDLSIQASDENKQMLFKYDYIQNTSLTQTLTLESIPAKIKLIFSNFTGAVSFTLLPK